MVSNKSTLGWYRENLEVGILMSSVIKNYLRKLTKNRAAMVLIIILGGAFFVSQAGPFMMGIPNEGFEGAKCNFYGLYFPSGSWGQFQGTDTLHRYQDAESALLTWNGVPSVTWTSLAVPNDAGINALKSPPWPTAKPDLKIHVESNLQLEEITRQGDPLGWNMTNPMDTQRIEYTLTRYTKISEGKDAIGNTVVIYNVTQEKESFILSPVEFWVGFYLVPAQEKAGTGSTWREGEYQNIVAWFMLDFNVWDNAYENEWTKSPDGNAYVTLFNGSIFNQKRTYEYRGGFPIAGWIQGWEKAGWTSTNSQQDGPVWADRRGGGGTQPSVDTSPATYTADQLAELKNELMAKVKFSPDLVGQMISLYDAPEVKFEYKSDLQPNFQDLNGTTADVKTPDSTMHKVMYFPINIDNFGTLVKGDWWHGWNVWYPSAYFRIRMIYGVYGTFTYLWTEEVTKPFDQGGLEFPEEVEREQTTVIHTEGVASWFEGLTDWLTNPMTLMWTFFIIIVIVILFVTIFNPGIWAMIFAGRRKTEAPARAAPTSGPRKKRWGQGHK